MPLTIFDLLQARVLHAPLAYPLDFCLSVETEVEPTWYNVEASEPFTSVARDSTGGRFLLGATSGNLLYISSEGRAGVVAASLTEFLRLLLLPVSWYDLLHFSAGGQLPEMHRCLEIRAEPKWRDDAEHAEEVAAAQTQLAMAFGLAPDPEALARLHRAVGVLSKQVRVVALDGTSFGELFNRFRAQP